MKTNIIKAIRSLPYWYVFVILGVANAILGPTLLLLQHNCGNDPGTYKSVFVSRSIGYCIGGLIGGIVYDILKYLEKRVFRAKKKYQNSNRNRFLNSFLFFVLEQLTSVKIYQSFFLFLISLGIVFQPYVHNTTSLFLLNLLVGFGNGTTEPGSDVVIAWIWNRNLNAAVYGLHFSYGLGTILFPLIIAQILSIPNINHLMLSYWVGTILIISPILIHCVFPSVRSTRMREEEESNESNEEQEKSTCSVCVGNLYWLVIALFYFFYCGCEISVGSLIVSFLVQKGMDNEVNASYLNSMFYLFFTIGRFFGVFENFLIPLAPLLFIHVSCCIVFSFALCFLGDNLWMVRVLVCCLGLSMSIIYPSNYALPKRLFNVEVTGLGTTFTLLGASVGQVLPALIQYWIQVYGNWDILFYAITVCFCFCMVVFWIEIVVGRYFRSKNKKIKEPSSDNSIQIN